MGKKLKKEKGIKWIYSFLQSCISIAETLLFDPSLLVISSVQISMEPTVKSVINLFLTISATSTALLIALPLAFNITSGIPLFI